MAGSAAGGPRDSAPGGAEAGLEARVREVGAELLAAARERKSSFWARERWEEALLHQLMERPAFRVQALRFVDVLPTLREDAELVRHLREYFGEGELPLPGPARWGLMQTRGMAVHALAGAVRAAMHALAARFIGGADTDGAAHTVEALRRDGLAATLDLLGEAAVSEDEAEEYLRRYLQLLARLAPRVERWKPHSLLDGAGEHASPRLNVSVKLSALYSQLNPVDPAGSVSAVQARLRPLLRAARERGAFVCLDMEQYDTRGLVLKTFRDTLEEEEFRDWPHAGLAIQAYLRETEADLHDLIAWARRRGTPVTVRLVRGAYWDYETVIAAQHGWPVPVWTRKWETDRCYERCLRLLFAAYPHVRVAAGTHNVRSLALALALGEHHGLQPAEYEVQMLYGMADPLKEAVARRGRRVRVYVPYGELLPGMAYLVRRLLENTASQSFLRMSFAENLPAEALLAAPAPEDGEAPPPAAPRREGAPWPGTPFRNEPARRFTGEGERTRFAAALRRVRGQLGREYPLLLHGREQTTGDWITSVNPAAPSEVVGRVASADLRDAEAALRSAAAAFPAWRDRGARGRAELLLRVAELLRSRRDEFSAWEVLEAGKTWREADADVTEAIDFLEYYAREAVRVAPPRPLHVPGERNLYHYQPRGVGVVIPPWNFPLAILTGMTAATLAAGNTCVLKPASQTPVIAAHLVTAFREAGLPEGVLNFVPGPGAAVGEYLVRHPLTHLVAFTGSRAVGTRIFRLAAELAEGQHHLKRVIAELGGKNAVIVDSDADLDDAVLGVIASAFGYQGQKCSAASRVITVGGIAGTFTRRLVEAARSLPVGAPELPGTAVGPVIDAAARERILGAIARGKQGARCLLEVDVSGLGDGYFVGPTVFDQVPPASPLAQEEIFGPVLAVLHARDFDDAVALANGTEYALTGGVYSRSPQRLAQARRELAVGNLYLNRKITGALVGRQPFGGFKLSGVGSKAGGPDYLLQFMEPRTVTENTIRRGFAADEDDDAAALPWL